MPTKARQAVAGKQTAGGRAGGSRNQSAAKDKTRGSGDKAVASISGNGQKNKQAAKKIGGGMVQHPGRLVPKKNTPTQGQGGKPGPATRSGKLKGTSSTKQGY